MTLQFRTGTDSLDYDSLNQRADRELEQAREIAQARAVAGEKKTRAADPKAFKAIASLLGFAEAMGYDVRFCKFELSDGRLKGNRIGIREGMTEQRTAFIMAHEIAHAFLHYDKGDTINSELHAEYEEQADRAAEMLLQMVLYMS